MTDPFFLTWLALSVATLLSWWLDASVEGAWVGTAVLLVAFLKTRLVLRVFMEVGHAPKELRWACDAWVAVACAAVVATYWLAPALAS